MDSTNCSGKTPVCSGSNSCEACDADNGAASGKTCPTTDKPKCVTEGTDKGKCVAKSDDSSYGSILSLGLSCLLALIAIWWSWFKIKI